MKAREVEKGSQKKYSYFSHRDCEYFPCHAGAEDENFNCLFCYCPLYVLGDRCGGNFSYNSNGHKDCSRCLYPHLRENYEAITGRYGEIAGMMLKPERTEGRVRDDAEDGKGGRESAG